MARATVPTAEMLAIGGGEGEADVKLSLVGVIAGGVVTAVGFIVEYMPISTIGVFILVISALWLWGDEDWQVRG